MVNKSGGVHINFNYHKGDHITCIIIKKEKVFSLLNYKTEIRETEKSFRLAPKCPVPNN